MLAVANATAGARGFLCRPGLVGSALMKASAASMQPSQSFASKRSADYPTLASNRNPSSPLVPLAPFDFFDRMFDDFDWPLQSFSRSPLFNQQQQQGTSHRMLMDVKETQDSYEVIVDLPGVETKDIDIKLRDDHIVINAHRETTKKEEGEHFHRVERRSGHITRSLLLPQNADRESIEAESKNGVLHIKMKKTETPQEHEKKIEIKQISNA